MSGVKPCIHGRNFCLECHASLTEQELKAKLDAALGREAALTDHLDAALRQVKANWDYAQYKQQRLTVAEQRLGDAYEWGYGDGQNSPNGYSDKEDRDKCIAELLKPSADPEHICECCGSKGWAANCDKCIPY